MTDRLRELFDEIADDAPRIVPSDGTWRRARRARLRDLVAIPIAVVVLLAVVGVSVMSLASTTYGGFEPADDEQAPALPDRLYAAPVWAEPSSDDLDVGPLSIVWSQARVDSVIGVSATTGEYVLFELPDYDQRPGFMAEQRPFVLSPDGRRLAYPWLDTSDPDASSLDGGIAVVDLVSGEVDRHRLEFPHGGRGWQGLSPSPSNLRWSPDGRRLAFRFDSAKLKANGSGVRPVSASAGEWQLLDIDTGGLTEWDRDQVRYDEAVTPAGDGRSLIVMRDSNILLVAPDGSRETVATVQAFLTVKDLLWTERGMVLSSGDDRLYLADPDGHGAQVLPGLGLYGRRTLLAASADAVASIGPLRRAVFGTAPLSPDSALESQQLQLFGDDVPPPQIQAISVAAIAIDAEPRPTSEPDWGMSPRAEKLLWLGAGAGGMVVIGLIGAVVLRRRGRWRSLPSRP